MDGTAKYLLMFLVAAIFLHMTNFYLLQSSNSNLAKKPTKPKNFNEGQAYFYESMRLLADWDRGGKTFREPPPGTSLDEDIYDDHKYIKLPSDNVTSSVTDEKSVKKSINSNTIRPPLPPCQPGPDLGPTSGYINIGNRTHMPRTIRKMTTYGGACHPSDCFTDQKVAIIVPYANRDSNMRLSIFLFTLHPLLAAQKLDYRIFVVQPTVDALSFPHPGKLMNLAAEQVMQLPYNYTCLIFHDPEVYPLNSLNMYKCSKAPKKLLGSVQHVFFRQNGSPWVHRVTEGKQYTIDVSRVLAITPNMLRTVNGFSNEVFTLTDAFSNIDERIRVCNFTMEKSNQNISAYGSLRQIAVGEIPEVNLNITKPLKTTDHLMDGLLSLSLHEGVSTITMRYQYLHTLITVHHLITVQDDAL